HQRVAPALAAEENDVTEENDVAGEDDVKDQQPPSEEEQILFEVKEALAQSDWTPASARFTQWLQQVQALPYDAVDWDDLPRFIAGLLHAKAVLRARLEG